MYRFHVAVNEADAVVTVTASKKDGSSGPKVTMYYPRGNKVTLFVDGTFSTEGNDGRKLFAPTLCSNGVVRINRLE